MRIRIDVYVVMYNNQCLGVFSDEDDAKQRKDGAWEDCPDFDQNDVVVQKTEAEIDWK
jgi:hypothetical protein